MRTETSDPDRPARSVDHLRCRADVTVIHKIKVSRFKEQELIFNHPTTLYLLVKILEFINSNRPKTTTAHMFPKFDH